MSLVASLYTGRSALIARQTQMAVIGSNVAKADQEGYHRQEVVLESNHPLLKRNYQLGTGVHVAQVVRKFDAALEANLQNSLEQQSYYEEYSRYLETTELVMAHEGESIMNDAMATFASGLQDLANDPESEIHRRALLANSERLAETINHQHALLTDVRDQIVSSSTVGVLPERVNDLNELATELASMNNLINIAEMPLKDGQYAIDYRDQRDRVVKEMAKLADISVTEDLDGFYNVEIGGTPLVTGTTVDDTLVFSLTAGVPAVDWGLGGAVPLNSGSIQGLIDSQIYIQGKITDVEDFATQLAVGINGLQATGYDKNGALGPALFDASVAGALSVLITDPNEIAASDSATNAGNGDNARAMWNLLNTSNVALGGKSLRETPDRLVDEVALEKNRADSLLGSSIASVQMFKELIQGKTGVSIEEEMILMLEVQRSFQGAAKFISATDGLLQTVINMV